MNILLEFIKNMNIMKIAEIAGILTCLIIVYNQFIKPRKEEFFFCFYSLFGKAFIFINGNGYIPVKILKTEVRFINGRWFKYFYLTLLDNSFGFQLQSGRLIYRGRSEERSGNYPSNDRNIFEVHTVPIKWWHFTWQMRKFLNINSFDMNNTDKFLRNLRI